MRVLTRVLGIFYLLVVLKTSVCAKNTLGRVPNGAMGSTALHALVHASAVYTPYHLTPGGGERVLLNFVKVIQRRTSGTLDLVVTTKNVCQSIECVQKLAETLAVRDIDWNRFAIKSLSEAREEYDVWFAMGNSLLPETASRGVYSIYHCQFPFDGVRDLGQHTALKRLTTYDTVYLNSKYTEAWYYRYLTEKREIISRLPNVSDTLFLPNIMHFPPPFDVHRGTARIRDSVRHIVLVGRVFQGTQAKRHDLAIQAFKTLCASLALPGLSLLLVGHIATGQEDYAELLHTEAVKGENIYTYFNAAPETLQNIISKADMVWSLTGLEADHMNHPADAEHFGIALLECMSAGLVPIVANVGGPVEILEGFPEYLKVNSVDQLVSATELIINATAETVRELSSRAVERATQLSTGFDNNENALFSFLGKELRDNNEQEWLALRAQYRKSEESHSLTPHMVEECQSIHEDEYAIVYLETRYDTALRANAFHLVRKLETGWRFHVLVSQRNANFFKHSLEGISCVVFHFLDDDSLYDPRGEGLYQQTWKSEEFLLSFGTRIKKIFHFQGDAWFPPNSNFLKSWVNFDYFGAPWCHKGNWGYLPLEERPKEAISMLHDSRQIPYHVRVGNGGISVRSIPAMLESVRRHSKHSSPQENEDVFYVLSILKIGGRVPTKEVAAEFSLEILCQDISAHKRLVDYFNNAAQGKRVIWAPAIPFALHKPFDILQHLCMPNLNKQLCLKVFLETFFRADEDA